MKLRFALCLGLAIVLLALGYSCKKIESLFSFTISNTSSITIPASSPLHLPVDIITPNVTSNSSEDFKNNNTNVNLVKNILLQEAVLKITSPAGQTFDFLQSIHVYISTNSTNEIELASLDSVPKGVSSIALVPTTAALDIYVKADSYKLRTSVTMREILSQDVTVEVNSKFKVTANL